MFINVNYNIKVKYEYLKRWFFYFNGFACGSSSIPNYMKYTINEFFLTNSVRNSNIFKKKNNFSRFDYQQNTFKFSVVEARISRFLRTNCKFAKKYE